MDDKGLRQAAEEGRQRLEQYCSGAEEDIKVIRRLTELGDMTDTTDPKAHELLEGAYYSTKTITQNFRSLEAVLEILYLQALAAHRERN
jgi:hypothetical protein